MTANLIDELIRTKVMLAGAAVDNADIIAQLVRSRLTIEDDGAIKVRDPDGNIRIGGGPHYADLTLDEYVVEIAGSKPGLFNQTKPEPEAPPPIAAPPANETVTARVLREATHGRLQATTTALAEPNPYAKGAINMTMQVLLEHRDPARAAQLQAEALAMPVRIVGGK